MQNQLEIRYNNLSPETIDDLLGFIKGTSKDEMPFTQAFLKNAIDSFRDEVVVIPGKDIPDKDLFLLRIQIVAAYLLILGRTDGFEFQQKYLLLLEMLSHFSHRSVNAMADRVAECLSGFSCPLGYSWSDIGSGFSCDILAYKAIQPETVLSDISSSSFTRKGTFRTDKDGITITPYSSTESGPFTDSLTICEDKLCVATKDNRDERLKASEANDVRKIESFVNGFCTTQAVCKVAKKETLKKYQEGDHMSVLVTGISDDGEIMVKTIDPSYKEVTGKIEGGELVVGLDVSDLTDYLMEDSCFVDAVLEEKDSECSIFSIFDSYLDYAESQANFAKRNFMVFEAKAINIFGKDNRINWLSYNGIGMISFSDQSVKVGDTRLLTVVSIKDNANGFYINARIAGDMTMAVDRSFNPEDVLRYFTKEYDYLMRSYVQPKGFEKTSSLTDSEIRSLATILSNSQRERNTLEQYRRLSVSRILFTLVGDTQSASLVQGQAAFLKNCILFARGETITFPERDVQYVCDAHRTILSTLLCLGNQDRESALCSLLGTVPVASKEAKIARLILAKNTALLSENDIGFTDAALRREIASILDISDMVVDEDCADIPTGKYGNTERQFREFKSSYVYRNDDTGADFLKQGRDEVFQAVCGLLNTNGGQVYIGVTNNGDPITDSNWGLSADIKWLKSNYVKVNAIRKESFGRNVAKVTDVDSYVNFLSDEKKIYFKDTVLDNIIIEPTEDMDAICISVSPSEYEIAYLYEDYTHTVGQAFRRDGNRTLPMTEAEKQKRLMRIQSIGKEIAFQIKIQEAIDQQKKIILKRYSSSDERDRFLAPINLLYGGESVWCVDLQDENKICKQFRLSRAEDVEVKDERYPHGKQKIESDIFRFTGERTIHIKLSMNANAKNYLLEEYPEARHLPETEFYKIGDDENPSWILDTHIANVVGIRRFYIGLADKIELLDTEDIGLIRKNIREYLDEFVENKIK